MDISEISVQSLVRPSRMSSVYSLRRPSSVPPLDFNIIRDDGIFPNSDIRIPMSVLSVWPGGAKLDLSLHRRERQFIYHILILKMLIYIRIIFGNIKRLKIILPHVGLVMMSMAYTILGALIFYLIERPNEKAVKESGLLAVQDSRRLAVKALWNIAQSQDSSETIFESEATSCLDNLTAVLFEAFKDNLELDEIFKNQTELHWTFAASLFFSATLITTIGYGHLVPQTFPGRFSCILFGLFGIPLILVTIADLGKFLSEFLLYVHGHTLDMYDRTSICCSVYSKRCNSCWQRIVGFCSRNRPFATKLPSTSEQILAEEKLNDRSYKSGFCDNASIQTSQGGGGTARAPTERSSVKKPNGALSDLAIETRIPLLLVLAILFGYTALGACILQLWETWSFFDAFYYCFVTVTTIGFGDIIPQNRNFLLVTLLYIITGLVITTMCIDLVGSQYIQKIHFFGRKFQTAKFAFSMMGDKMMHMGDALRLMTHFQKKYGLTAEQMERAMNLPDGLLAEFILKGKPLPSGIRSLLTRPYVPQEIHLIRYIDQRSLRSMSMHELMIASIDSLEMTGSSTLCSTRTNRDTTTEMWMQWQREAAQSALSQDTITARSFSPS